MIYLEINREICSLHQDFLDKYDLLGKLDILDRRYSHSEFHPLISFMKNKLADIIIGDLNILEAIQSQYLEIIYNIPSFVNKNHQIEKYPSNVIEEFKEIFYEISKVFIDTYDNFTSQKSSASWGSYKYLKQLGQYVCPYCNANYIHTIQAQVKLKSAGSRAMADLDHFIPKSLYPFFAISIYNLVPSCVYCNQRFKRNYEADFRTFFSPFEKEIENSFQFKFTYRRGSYKSVYEKKKELGIGRRTEQKQHYINLLKKLNSLKSFEEVIKDANRMIKYTKKKKLILIKAYKKVYKQQNDNTTKFQLSKILRKIIKALDIIMYRIKKFAETKDMSILEKEVIALNSRIIGKLNSIKYHFEKYKELEKLGPFGDFTNAIRDSISYVKKYLIDNIATTFSTFLTSDNTDLIDSPKKDVYHSTEDVDFVKICYGESDNYQIEIDCNSSDLMKKRKVYNNVALFQLEEVYNSFIPVINRRFAQSKKISELYLLQLKMQFPQLIPEEQSSNLEEHLRYVMTNKDAKTEVLGKLINELVVPIITKRGIRDF